MPYRRKDSPVWWASYSGPGGKRVRRSTETTNRREAEALEAKWKTEAFQCKHWGIVPDEARPRYLFEELMTRYLQEVAERKRSIERDAYSANRLLPFFEGRDLAILKRPEINRYIEERRQAGARNGTINRELGLFSAAINHARREWEWDIPNNVQGTRLKEPEGRVRSLTPKEAARLVEVAGSLPQVLHLGEFIELALNTGCRRDELLRLEWDRVTGLETDSPLMQLGGKDTKNGKRRSVPLNAVCREALGRLQRFKEEHCPSTPWVFAHKDGERLQSVKKSFATACRKAGIEDFRIHDLRHTAASWLVSNGTALPEVRDLLGHSTVKMTERYAHLAPERVRFAVDVLASVSRSGHAGEGDLARIE